MDAFGGVYATVLLASPVDIFYHIHSRLHLMTKNQFHCIFMIVPPFATVTNLGEVANNGMFFDLTTDWCLIRQVLTLEPKIALP